MSLFSRQDYGSEQITKDLEPTLQAVRAAMTEEPGHDLDIEILEAAIAKLQKISRLASDCRQAKLELFEKPSLQQPLEGYASTAFEVMQAVADGLEYRVKVELADFDFPALDYRMLCAKPDLPPVPLALGDPLPEHAATIEAVANTIADL